jgi:hypothetical protein
MLNAEDSNMAAQAICHEAHMTGNAQREAEYMRTRPSVLYRPALKIDGSKWCALYGDNLQDGVAGFGDSPGAAFADFDVMFYKAIPAPQPPALAGRGET